MAIYKVVKGRKVELTATEIKSKIKQWQGWTDKQYKSQYNIIRNKLRNYEKFVRESGGQIESQNVQQFLYFESQRAKSPNYTPSIKMRTIQSFSARSTTARTGRRAKERATKIFASGVNSRFAGLINANPMAREIAEKVTNPVARDRALAEFANKLHLKMKQSGEAESKSAIPYGQKIGSTEAIDFDYSAYLGY